MFFIVAGSGLAFAGEGEGRQVYPVSAGDTIVFPPGCVHGIDALEVNKLYCLELMLPNEKFAEFVRQGQPVNIRDVDDMCVLAAIGCR
jgi:mannose-6-phosphate isomerase-like protein (cupin superfamily)